MFIFSNNNREEIKKRFQIRYEPCRFQETLAAINFYDKISKSKFLFLTVWFYHYSLIFKNSRG
jgi:hypothetical protein